MSKLWKKFMILCLVLLLLPPAAVFGISVFMVKSQEEYILHQVTGRENTISKQVVATLANKNPDCIMVLGAQAMEDGSPSYILKDRLDVGIKLYKQGVAPKLLLTGDHGQRQYDEANAMKAYAIAAGVPKEDLFLDHAGFSTYDSVYRAKAIFQVERAIVVTQGYHQYRTLYACKRMGIEAWGVSADQIRYGGQDARDLREIAARDKDFFKWMLRPKPKYLGERIPISGSGVYSQD